MQVRDLLSHSCPKFSHEHNRDALKRNLRNTAILPLRHFITRIVVKSNKSNCTEARKWFMNCIWYIFIFYTDDLYSKQTSGFNNSIFWNYDYVKMVHKVIVYIVMWMLRALHSINKVFLDICIFLLWSNTSSALQPENPVYSHNQFIYITEMSLHGTGPNLAPELVGFLV